MSGFCHFVHLEGSPVASPRPFFIVCLKINLISSGKCHKKIHDVAAFRNIHASWAESAGVVLKTQRSLNHSSIFLNKIVEF